MHFVQLLYIVFILVGHPDAGRWKKEICGK
jgi:hypothetical protein